MIMTSKLSGQVKVAHVTGHRPKSHWGTYDENDPRIQAVKESLEIAVRCLAINDGYKRFVSGMAIGVDTWFAEAVLQAQQDIPHIELIAAVPFEGQEGRWPKQTQERYHRILDQCAHVHTVCDGGYSPTKMQQRNEWMVDHSHLTIAVWNGQEGGTGNCVEYARARDHKIIHIDPDNGQLVYNDRKKRAYQARL